MATPEQRYKAYVSWCGRCGIVPAFFSVWWRTVSQLPEKLPISWRGTGSECYPRP
jgi:hypothetical protein